MFEIKIRETGESFKVKREEIAKFYLKLENDYFDDSNVNVVLVNTGDIKKLV